MIYSGSGVNNVDGDGKDDGGSGIGGSNCCLESTDLVLNSLPSSYSKLNVFLCKS